MSLSKLEGGVRIVRIAIIENLYETHHIDSEESARRSIRRITNRSPRMRIKNAGPSEVARLDRQLATWFWLFSRRLLDLLVAMDGRPFRIAGCFLLIASAVRVVCATLWQTAPHQDSAKPNVQ